MSLQEVLQYPAFFLLTASVMLTSFAQPSLNLHTIPYLTDQGVGAGTAAAVLTVWAVFGAVGSLVPGVPGRTLWHPPHHGVEPGGHFRGVRAAAACRLAG